MYIIMKMEKEITVLVKTDYKTLEKELKENNFVLKEEYVINDIYMIDDSIDILNTAELEILKNCILVRDIKNITKELLYKYKEYDDKGNIIEQGKVKCPITNIDKAIEFMEAIKYKKLFQIYDKCLVFANTKTELVVQLVNNKYILIEMEDNCEYIDKKYETIEELKQNLFSYNLSIDKSNIFVKKALLVLNDTVKRTM